MKSDNISVDQDKAIIDAGGFFCLGCLIGKPSENQSNNPKYCQDCFELLSAESKREIEVKQGRDYWTDSGKILVTGGKRFVVTSTGQTICVAETFDADAASNATEATPVAKKAVTTLSTKGIAPVSKIKGRIMLQKRKPGRPKKEGKVTRMTEYRRKKAEQGVLL